LSRSVMLLAMDKFEGVVVFATNLAQNYDSAFVRRIHNHIKFELPDLAAREHIFEKMLVPELPLDPEVTAKSLAMISEGLSGGDLRTIVINAAAKAVSRTGLEQLVKKADFEQAISETLKAKQEISKPTTQTQVSEEEVPINELSEEVKTKYEQAVS
jgi:ATP-dependent 26S proteasome regulatory subunit